MMIKIDKVPAMWQLGIYNLANFLVGTTIGSQFLFSMIFLCSIYERQVLLLVSTNRWWIWDSEG